MRYYDLEKKASATYPDADWRIEDDPDRFLRFRAELKIWSEMHVDQLVWAAGGRSTVADVVIDKVGRGLDQKIDERSRGRAEWETRAKQYREAMRMSLPHNSHPVVWELL